MRHRIRDLMPVFILVAVVAVSGTGLVYWLGLRVTWANARLLEAQGLAMGLEGTLSTVKDAETGQRGYLLSGDEQYLEPYLQAVDRIDGDLRLMSERAEAGRVDRDLAAEAARLIAERLWVLEEGLRARREGGLEAALAVAVSGRGLALMEQTRGVFDALQAEAQSEIAALEALRDRSHLLRTLSGILLGAVQLAFLVWAYRRIKGEIDGTEQQRQLLAVTLASIGDAVILTDNKGGVTFLNAEAEKLTGWKSEEAEGQPLPEVFHIVNEETREPVESPVDKVLRLGTVVGLANHTVLIAKDGRERPIDDSGAPIRKADGSMHGVVLVFRDFSQHRETEAVLRQSEERYRFLFDRMTEGFALHEVVRDDDGNPVDCRFLDINHAFEDLTGLRREEVVGRLVSETLGRIGLYAVEACGQVALTGEPQQFERYVGVLSRHFEIRAYSPVPGQFAVLLTDITERRRIEEALRVNLTKYSVLFDSFPLGITVTDEQGRVVETNEAAARLLGLPVGRSDEDHWTLGGEWRMVGPDGRAIDTHDHVGMRALRERRNVQDAEMGILHDDSRITWISATAAPLPLEGYGVVVAYGDVTERKRMEQQVREAKEAAEEASQAKDRFLATLSHELRTPLTPVLAAVSMLQRDARLDDDVRQTLEIIRRNVEVEARLIDDLLDLTRIVRGKLELEKRPVDLCCVVAQAVEVCRPDIDERGLEFHMEAPDSPCTVEADAARLQQVFWNLIKNAVKFTPPGGRVAIRCRREADEVSVEVEDTGEGIAPEVLPRLFSAFEQGESNITRQFGGLGLGLAISRSLVQFHGGTIAARSEGKGRGAAFEVRLPLLAVECAPAQTGDGAAAVASDEAIRPRSLRVLLVEDHPDTAELMRDLLEFEGHRVVTAGTVAAAVETAAGKEFDVVVSDLGLPDGHGADLIRRLRDQGYVAPAIALSGHGQEQDIRRSLDAGFTTHVIKPVSVERLLAVLERVTTP